MLMEEEGEETPPPARCLPQKKQGLRPLKIIFFSFLFFFPLLHIYVNEYIRPRNVLYYGIVFSATVTELKILMN